MNYTNYYIGIIRLHDRQPPASSATRVTLVTTTLTPRQNISDMSNVSEMLLRDVCMESVGGSLARSVLGRSPSVLSSPSALLCAFNYLLSYHHSPLQSTCEYINNSCPPTEV